MPGSAAPSPARWSITTSGKTHVIQDSYTWFMLCLDGKLHNLVGLTLVKRACTSDVAIIRTSGTLYFPYRRITYPTVCLPHLLFCVFIVVNMSPDLPCIVFARSFFHRHDRDDNAERHARQETPKQIDEHAHRRKHSSDSEKTLTVEDWVTSRENPHNWPLAKTIITSLIVYVYT